MNKKLLIVSILCVFTLVAISYASAINTTTVIEKKESPLFGIRTRRAVREKIGEIIENIKTKYIGERVFFLPFQWSINSDGIPIRKRMEYKSAWYTDPTCGDPDCYNRHLLRYRLQDKKTGKYWPSCEGWPECTRNLLDI